MSLPTQPRPTAGRGRGAAPSLSGAGAPGATPPSSVLRSLSATKERRSPRRADTAAVAAFPGSAAARPGVRRRGGQGLHGHPASRFWPSARSSRQARGTADATTRTKPQVTGLAHLCTFRVVGCAPSASLPVHSRCPNLCHFSVARHQPASGSRQHASRARPSRRGRRCRACGRSGRGGSSRSARRGRAGRRSPCCSCRRTPA